MLRDLALPRRAPLTEAIAPHWRRPLLHLVLAWGFLLVMFAHVVADMARQFWDSSTYNHILFVPFIIGWLVHMRAAELVKITPQAWWPGLIGVAGALFLWLLGDLTGLALATHLALVLLLQASAITLLGVRVTAALLFPMAYMLFLVPFGDELVPALQMITADLTIALVHLSGIPAVIDGVFIDTPIGLFEVAEACSGVKFLVAMVALGTLAAHVCFVSWWRRAGFMVAAIVLPILANSVRAWGTIYIAQSQGIEFAVGFDHIFYGWVFFALVMGLLLAMAWPFFDRPRDDRFVDGQAIADWPLLAPIERFRTSGTMCLGVIAALVAGIAAWSISARAVVAEIPAQIALPAVPGWQQVEAAPGLWWEPRAGGADHRLLAFYQDADGAHVDVFYALYAAQDEGREAGSFGQGALMPDTDWRWHSPGPDFGMGLSDRLQAYTDTQRLALTLYRHRDLTTGSVAQLKLSNIRDRLTFDPHPTITLILSAPEGGPVSAEESLRRFLSATGEPGAWMDRVAQLP
ncbi:exosortase A [Altererythrobacter lauratis]|uniref:Exosortase A n=1 Tax=Alteraurantiacibacter lauratis TaxID=2054627 RepID=A0ABV7EDV3_9SPHN